MMANCPLATAAIAGLLAPTLSAQSSPIFTEITRESGIDFVHDPGTEGKYMAPEVMGSGGAFFDYDNDGDLDIYLVQAGPLPESKKPRPPDRLYRQDANGKFTEVTAGSGLGDTGYGTGVAVGDIDNNGFVDVFVTNYGSNTLYRNQGNGKFTNITANAGIQGNHWSASSAFCDYDADGFLDLYVTNYVKFDPTKVCVKGDGAPDYCSPQSLPYETDILYHNNGNGTFTDVTRQAGISAERLPGLGVVCSDLTGDGRVDIYVANDGEPNNLWVNQGNGKFEDYAFLMGAAVSAMGRPQASMGIALGDIDSDSDLDLFFTHLINDYNTLYVNDGKYGFEDQSAAAGLVAPSLSFTGFGTAFLDYEHDGDLDIVVVNGAVDRHKPYPGAAMSDYWNRYAEPKHLYQNDGKARFTEISKQVGSFATDIDLSRGLAVGDVDRDGDLDLLVVNTAGPARLYRNDARKVGSWLLVRAWDDKRKRDAHSAVVTVTASGKKYVRVADPGFSYLSSNDPRAHFGIPGASRADGVTVRWPDGVEEAFPGVALNQSIVLKKGGGKPSTN
ncbi:MAG TPA: CRTAC1 family protein [Vicinamibacteria bacterium]|jgi:hypothetical protein